MRKWIVGMAMTGLLAIGCGGGGAPAQKPGAADGKPAPTAAPKTKDKRGEQ